MSEAYQLIAGGNAPVLIVADHASAHVPADIDLGIAPHLLNEHVAVDLGVAEVAALLAEQLGCRAILGGVSRLVLDLNREEDHPTLIPQSSDGHIIAGNLECDRQERIERFYRPYHARLDALIAELGHPFIVSLHSFTPQLASDPSQKRPWEIGVLYNDDDRGARIAIPLLEQAGLVVGDQLPYSGKQLNFTMNHHVEARGLPYLGVEMRQDMSGTAQGQARYADILATVVQRCHASLQPRAQRA